MTSLWGVLMAGVRGDTGLVPRARLEGSTALPHSPAAGLALLLAQRGGRAGTAQPRRGQGAGREGRQQLCTPVWVSTTHSIPLPWHCPALQEHPHGRVRVLISDLFPLPTPPLSASSSSATGECLGWLRKSPRFPSHHPLSLPRALPVTH